MLNTVSRMVECTRCIEGSIEQTLTLAYES